MRRILITGAAGFMGRHLVSALLRDKYNDLILTDKNEDSTFLAYCNGYRDNSWSFYNLDITNRDTVFDLFKREKIDTCIHLAGKVKVEESIRNPQSTMDVNVKGTLNMLDACCINETKNFIFASSASVYGDPIELPIDENHTLSPISPYGTSKMLAEKYVSSYADSGKIQNSISLRIFNAYGKGQNGKDVLTNFAKRLSDGLPPIIYGDGMQKRDFISIIDVVNAFILSIKALDQKRRSLQSSPSWIFNIGTGVPTSINEIAKLMIKISGLNLDPIHQKTKAQGEIKESCADITKSKKILQFFPRNKLEVQLKDLVRSRLPTTLI